MNEENVDYRKMYYHLAGAVENALRILIAAQKECVNILLENDIVSEEITASNAETVL